MKSRDGLLNRVIVTIMAMLSASAFFALVVYGGQIIVGWETCPACNNDDYAKCHACGNCNGLGIAFSDCAYRCIWCDGAGGFWEPAGGAGTRCTFCNGTGCGYCWQSGYVAYLGYEWHPCPSCGETGYQSGYVPCEDCDGNGWISCDTCDGNGVVPVFDDEW